MKVWIEDKNFRYVENETMAETIVRAYLYHELGKNVSPENGMVYTSYGSLIFWATENI